MSMMKFKLKYLILGLLIITVFILVGIGGRASNREVSKEVPQQVINKIMEEFPSPQSAIYLYKNKIQAKTIIKPAFIPEEKDFTTVNIDHPSWFFIVDETPAASFSHPIKIGIIDSETEEIKSMMYNFDWWPSLIDNNNKEISLQYFLKNKDSLFIVLKEGAQVNGGSKVLMKEASGCPNGFSDSPFPKTLIGQEEKGKSNENFWAILICGEYATRDLFAFAKDTDCMYSVLKGYGVDSNHIIYLMPKEIKAKIQKNDIGDTNFQFKHTDAAIGFSGTKEIGDEFLNIAKKNKVEKFLFLISSHGVVNNLCIRKGDEAAGNIISCADLKKWLKLINCKESYILIDACKSGSFIGAKYNSSNRKLELEPNKGLLNPAEIPNGTKRFVIVSACCGESSYSDVDDCISNSTENNENNYDRGTEFLGGFIEAFSQKSADKNEDDKISLGEAFDYAKLYAYYAEKRCSNVESECNHPCSETNSQEKAPFYKEFLFGD
ncbi:MAG TPA: caspase family protein [Candidatus Deferrimicrobium sp.]|nr:caspase family protein [Candidatus Kapabacteria bacterium]HLP59762.1 caspase family protein [Candidatus Deferrimicrobium sp.]